MLYLYLAITSQNEQHQERSHKKEPSSWKALTELTTKQKV
jgi:hypothetical protein